MARCRWEADRQGDRDAHRRERRSAEKAIGAERMGRFAGHGSVYRPNGSAADSWFGYTCSHCGSKVSGAVVASQLMGVQDTPINNRWLACTECGRGSVETGGVVYPGTKFGPALEGLPAPVDAAYDEARRCMQASAYTAAEL